MNYTSGPWYSDGSSVWRRPPNDLYENGGTVAGDKPIATAHKGWHDEDGGYPQAANAQLIAAAPAMYEALRYIKEHSWSVLGTSSKSYAMLEKALDSATTP